MTNILSKRWWYDERIRGVFFQLLAVLGVFLIFHYAVGNALNNLEARGITTGFDFLDDHAGFSIIQTLIPYDETYSFGRTFVVGLLNTLLVSFLGIILATILGFMLGISRLSQNWLLAKISSAYIEVFRNIPLLLQIYFWYFAVLRALPAPRQSLSLGEAIFMNLRGLYVPKPIPEVGALGFCVSVVVAVVLSWVVYKWARYRQDLTGQDFPVIYTALALLTVLPLISILLFGVPFHWEYPKLTGFNFSGGVTIIPELAALLIALTIYTAAFIAEVVRSGILAVNYGQTEAAHALGINRKNTLNLVIIPQAMRVIIPPLTSQYLNLTKNSSLATAIGYPDLVAVFMGTTLNQTGQAIEVIVMTMAVYLTITLTTSFFMNIYNRRMLLVER